jgi:hypothetical protein
MRKKPKKIKKEKKLEETSSFSEVMKLACDKCAKDLNKYGIDTSEYIYIVYDGKKYIHRTDHIDFSQD